ncbi:MAG: UDP-N-acetylmuramate--L-alanine ligase [Ignavibacteria bacterium]
MREELKNIEHIHFIGIGGIGMSGLAEYLTLQGYKISGSELNLSSITERLEKLGIKIFQGHSKENIGKNIQLVVYTSAVKNDNPELQEAYQRNMMVVKRSKLLGLIVNRMKTLAISGTHGKTTTSAMLAKVLIDSGLDPDVFIGGSVRFLNDSSMRVGCGEIAVVEADEYDRSFLDLDADIIVINNIELDHPDIYQTVEEVKQSFYDFIKASTKEPVVIANIDDINVLELIKEVPCKLVTYGFSDSSDYNIRIIDSEHFLINGVEIELSVFGRHNMYNATAVFVVASLLNISVEIIRNSLRTYSGLHRRLELRYSNEIKIFDDYAHHPSEILASLVALKNNYDGRIVTVFQPHTYTRTQTFYKEFADALSESDYVILTPVYPARENKIPGVSSELIYEELKNLKKIPVTLVTTLDNLIGELKSKVGPKDIVLFQGAGNITDYCTLYLKELTNE